MFLLSKLKDVDFWERHLRDRLAEPLHLNLISLFVQAFGSFRAKVAFDLVERRRDEAYPKLARMRPRRLRGSGILRGYQAGQTAHLGGSEVTST